MKKSPNFWFILVLLVLFGEACKSDMSAPIIMFGKDYFPNDVGDEWVYDVYDSIQHSSYLVRVTIVGKTTVLNKQATVWTYSYPIRIDTNYVVSTNDTIRFYSNDLFEVLHIYVVPLKVGDTWFGGWIGDTYNVIEMRNRTINSVVYDSAYRLSEDAYSPNFIRTKDEWFVPRVGMVERYRFEYDFSLPDKKVWKLRSNKLNNTAK